MMYLDMFDCWSLSSLTVNCCGTLDAQRALSQVLTCESGTCTYDNSCLRTLSIPTGQTFEGHQI